MCYRHFTKGMAHGGPHGRLMLLTVQSSFLTCKVANTELL